MNFPKYPTATNQYISTRIGCDVSTEQSVMSATNGIGHGALRHIRNALAMVGLLAVAALAQADEVLFCSGFESPDCQVTQDQQPPIFVHAEPAEIVVTPGSIPLIGADIVEERSGLDPTSIQLFHDDVDVSAEIALVDMQVRYALAAPPGAGAHRWRIRARDNAGNQAEYEWRYLVTSSPEISAMAPVEESEAAEAVTISARIVDQHTALRADLVSLRLDGERVELGTALELIDAHTAQLDWTPPASLAVGRHVVILEAVNERGATTVETWGFWVREAPIYQAEFLEPAEGFVTQQPSVRVAILAGSNESDVASVLINGEIAGTDAGADRRVFYTRDVVLAPGANSISVVIGFSNGQVRSLSRTVTFDAAPVVVISTPADFHTFGPDLRTPVTPGGALNLTGNVEHPVRISGSTDRPVVSVEINQQAATLDASGTAFEFTGFFLHEGTNVLTATAVDAQGRNGSASVTVYVDHTAPLLAIEGPSADAVTSAQRIDIRGSVSDAVSGLVNTPNPQVSVRNLANDTTTIAQVYQAFFIAEDVPLAVGANALEVVAVDGVGNVRTQTIRVTRVGVGSKRVVQYSGNRQQAQIGSELPEALAAHVLDAEGNPLTNTAVRFDILRGDGSLAMQAGTPTTGDGVNPARNMVVNTDGNGIAQVWLTLGSESGVAANVVRAAVDGIAEEVEFTASAVRGAPKWVLADGSSGTQFALSNSRAMEPLTVVVYDSERNRVENATVEYRIQRGDAAFDAQSWPGGTVIDEGAALRVQTDRNGNASARPLLGFAEGDVRITARAVDAESTPAAMFTISVLAQRDGDTALRGTVLDHTGAPLPGVQLSISRTNLSTSSDQDGIFRFESQVPPGKIDVFIDGRTAPAPAGTEYPALHFETTIIRGRDNQLPHAIYLPPVNLSQAKVVGGNEDVSLTIPGLEGFELIVKAGSVTFPDGSRIGPVVVSPVHADRLPMVPTGGAASFGPVAWTLQPSSTRFDPPIEVRIPNTGGLRPGETTSIVQWDHDLATFVPMGLGTVNEDATQIVSNPGSGITKAGWGGCTGDCPPPPPNCGASSDAPQPPAYREVEAFNLRPEYFGWIVYEDIVDLDRISKNHKTRFKDKTFRVESNWFFEGRCDSARYEWLFGDGGNGSGAEVDHQYEMRGSTTLRETIVCNYTSKCDASPGSVDWPKDWPIRLRDTKWIEFKEAMDECGWTAGCWLYVRAQEDIGEISELMGQLEIEWLSDLRDWNRETLDMMGPGSGQVPAEAKLATLAFLHAANETVFPTGILDVVPVGKATKALKLIRFKYGASVDELADLASKAAQTCGIGRAPDAVNPCKLAWQRFEDAGRLKAQFRRCGGLCPKAWQPIRNVNNGFDGAVVWRDPFGKLKLTLTESKMWSRTTDPVEVSDLTAFGFGANPGTLGQNLDIVVRDLRTPGFVPGATVDEIEELIENITLRNDFDIVIHTLAETRLDTAAISARIAALTGRAPDFITGF